MGLILKIKRFYEALLVFNLEHSFNLLILRVLEENNIYKQYILKLYW